MFNIIELLKCEHCPIMINIKIIDIQRNRSAVWCLALMDRQYDAIGLTEFVLSNQNLLTNKRQRCVR